MDTIKEVKSPDAKERITLARSYHEVEMIKDTAKKRAIARRILENLHDWFEVEESREQYIRDCSDWMFFAIKENDDYAGFLCLKETGRQTVELAVMGVLREYHRNGLGSALFQEAQRVAAHEGYAFMQVKTVKMGVYEDYDITNRFYLSLGFAEFEVMEALWGKENPCQIYVMSLKKTDTVREDI